MDWWQHIFVEPPLGDDLQNPDLVDSSAVWDGLSSSSGATLQDYLDAHPLMDKARLMPRFSACRFRALDV